MRFPLVFAFLLLFFCANFAHANWNFLDDEAEAGGFDLSARVASFPARFYIAKQENGDGYTLNFAPDSFSIAVVQANKSRPLAAQKLSAKAPFDFVLQRRGPRFRVILGGKIVMQAENDLFSEGPIGVQGGAKNVRVQPVEPIVFEDDFMRVASEAALENALKNPRHGIKISEAQITETIWSSAKGRWATTGLTENADAQVAQSANPFAFRPMDVGENLAVAGQPFWSDYKHSVSVQPQGASEIGVLAYAQDEKNYLGLFWSENGDPQIRAVLDGAPRVLAAAKGFGAFEQKQWYRLAIHSANGTLRAVIDDEEVARAQTGLFARGKIGLWAKMRVAGDDKKALGAVFDDSSVRSTRDFTDDFATPIPGRWTTVAGAWNFANRAKPANNQGAFAVMGEGIWANYRVSGDLNVPQNGASGLLLHHIAGKGAYLLRVGGSNSPTARGAVQIARLEGGKTTVLAQKTVGARFNNSRASWKFENERGYLSAKISGENGDELVLDAFDENLKSGRAGVFAQGGHIENFAVEFPTLRSMWAKVPALYEVETQAKTMGGWSTPEGFWTQQNGAWQHKGDFWGDSEIAFNLPDLSGQKRAILSFGNAKKLHFEAEKITLGSTVVARKNTPNERIEVLRRGNFLIVRAGENAVLATRV